MIRDRADTAGVAVLTAPLNIGWGRKARRPVTGSILVVGGGIAGRAVARVLARHGLGCTVVERRESVGRGMGVNCPATRCGRWASWASPPRRWPAAYLCDDGSTATAEGGCSSPWTRIASGARSGDRSACATATCWPHSHFPTAAMVEHARAVAARPTPAGRRGRAGGSAVAAALRLRDRRRRRRLGDAGGGRRRRPAPVVDDRVELAVRRRQPWRRLLDGVVRPGRDLPADPGRGGPRLRVRRPHPRWGHRGRPLLVGAGGRGFPDAGGAAVAQALDGGELHQASVDEVRLERWHNGRLVLIGDAAHATGPVWAQGVAMALEDAMVLGELLARPPQPSTGAESGPSSNGSGAPGSSTSSRQPTRCRGWPHCRGGYAT